MNKFIFKCILFILPIIGLLFGDIFMSKDTFTHRPWEALLFKSNKDMYFYPNQRLNKKSVGDLCHHTEFAIKKDENWITDALGYRNNTFVEKPDVLFIGDSFIVGSSITQDSTITNSLKKKLNSEIYNIAPADFVDFIDLLDQNIIDKPKIIIYSLNERSIPIPIISHEKKTVDNVSSFLIFKDKVKRLYSLKYLKSRLYGEQGKGVKGKVDSSMFFLYGKEQKYHYDKVIIVAKNIQSYKEYCDSIGVEFIFMSLPNKETVYFDKIPLERQPDYLIKLDSILIDNKVKTINTLEQFNDYRKTNNDLIYHLDDSHWNARGVELITKKLAEFITTDIKVF